MSEINVAARMRLAAHEKAEAEKILQIKPAECEAESKYMSGLGIACQKQVSVNRLSDSVLGFAMNVPGTTTKGCGMNVPDNNERCVGHGSCDTVPLIQWEENKYI